MRGKNYQAATKLVDKKKTYAIEEAVALVKQMSKQKFDASVELHVRLGIDPSKGDQQVRGTVNLPHGTGRSKRVAAFVEAEKEAEAKAAGADIVGGEELIEKIAKTGVIEFDVAVATPAIMAKLSKLAKILGPKGLMPNPKTETINPNIGKIVKEQKAGKLSFKNDATGNVHQMFGRVSFDGAKLKENLTALLEAIRKVKPSSSKGIYFRNIVICSTMSPGVHIEIPS
ncbi:50S ribosomal protein L1 [Candidatus Uhrbacteria bacterium]|nr:50S ribosomal protein L1 [Candidatus Uhrbacteria bacterium]